MIVVKLGGSVFCRNPQGAAASVAKVRDAVVIHGGGCYVNELLKSMGIEPKFLTHPNGVVSRYTDFETLKVFVMAMSWINKYIVAHLNASGTPAVGLTGADGAVVKAKRKEKVLIIDERGRQRVIDGGYSGRITEIDMKALIPPPVKVIAPIAMSERGELLNVDGDQLAFEIAVRAGAKQLVILSDVDGLIINGSVVSQLTPEEAEVLAKSEEVRGGMKRKLLMAAEAAKAGVEVIIYNGLVKNAVELALNGAGTHVRKI